MSAEQQIRRELRFVDLCAGLGGFHHALSLMAARLVDAGIVPPKLTCVAAAEIEPDLRECYVRNFPDIAETYRRHQPALRRSFENSDAMPQFDPHGRLLRIHGDLACFLDEDQTRLRRGPGGRAVLPPHDLLCAGFPCQPFSKSGKQTGFDDTRGTVFHVIATMLHRRRPAFVLLENVGNFERHAEGRTWERVRAILEGLKYDVVATEHVTSSTSSSGLLSPHHLGYPHHRERFFIIAQRRETLPSDSPYVRHLLNARLSQRHPFPDVPRARAGDDISVRLRDRVAAERLHSIIAMPKRAEEIETLKASQVSPDRVRCVTHWQTLLDALRAHDARSATSRWRETMPSFPIWGYELDPWRWYPATSNPRVLAADLTALRARRENLLATVEEQVGSVRFGAMAPGREHAWLAGPMTDEFLRRWISEWPAYAGQRNEWPAWKARFITQNRAWAVRLWRELDDPTWLREWMDSLFTDVPAPSNQKLEWNCKGEPLVLWDQILQFRPSGLRVKRLVQVPALVAMTTTQVPIVPRLNDSESLAGAAPGSRGRHLLPSEALQLQGLPPNWSVPNSRDRVFTCLGNAVHAGLVGQIFASWLFDVGPELPSQSGDQDAANEGLPLRLLPPPSAISVGI